jgi:hypothetical protein
MKGPNNQLYHGEADNAVTALQLYKLALLAELGYPGTDEDDAPFKRSLAQAEKAYAIVMQHVKGAIAAMKDDPDLQEIADVLESEDYSQLAF